MPKRKGVIEPIDAPFDEVVSTKDKILQETIRFAIPGTQ